MSLDGSDFDEKKQALIDEFLLNATLIWSDKYDYSQLEYVNGKVKIKIICKEHGIFVKSAQKDGKSPTVSEIAVALDTTEEKILESMEVGQTAMVISLDSPSYKSDNSRAATSN